MREKLILYGFTAFGLLCLPFAFKGEQRKDWIIVFLLKAFISVLLGNIVAGNKLIRFPVRLFPKSFQSTILYDMLLLPLLCVYYNRTTYKSKITGIITKAFVYSAPHTILEYWMEKKTKLIDYKKWKGYYTFFSVAATFLLVRAIIEFIRKTSSNNEPKNRAN